MSAAAEINALRAAGAALAEGDGVPARTLVDRLRREQGDAAADDAEACIRSHARVLRGRGPMFARPPDLADRRRVA